MSIADEIYSHPEYPVLSIKNPYTRSWKLMSIHIMDKPKNIKELLWLIWGFDIFYGEWPFLKTLVAANVLVWVALWLTR